VLWYALRAIRPSSKRQALYLLLGLVGGIRMTVAIKIERSKQANPQHFWRPSPTYLPMLKRIWWHVQALIPVVGILLLILASLIFLQLHWLYRNWLKVSIKSRLRGAGWVN
jgi:cobalamin synthase